MGANNQQIGEVAEDIISLIIDYPQDLKIEAKEENNITILKISLHKDDVGKVIGKKGQNMSALRILLKAVSVKRFKKRLIISLYENNYQIYSR